MPSAAYAEWIGGGRDRLTASQRLAAGALPRSPERQQIEHGTVVLLAAEFQRYCRTLHELVVDELMKQTATQTPDLEIQIRNALRATGLTTGNATPRNINLDFRRLGLPGLTQRVVSQNSAAASWLDGLDTLLRFRNAVAHGDPERVSSLLVASPPGELLTLGVAWSADLDGLAAAFDDVTAGWLDEYLLGGRPW